MKVDEGSERLEACAECEAAAHIERRGVYMCLHIDLDGTGLQDKWGDSPDIDEMIAENGFPDWCPLPDSD